jgi:uncharacterized damage-inducible protein DinB
MSTPTISPISLVLGDADNELASTRRVLERFPDGRGDWQPHVKSRTLGQLAAHVATLCGLGTSIITTDGIDRSTRPPSINANSAAELLALFDARRAEFDAAIAGAGESILGETWSIKAGDRILISLPKPAALRSVFMNHLIHHRAQLGVYYRLLDVPLPILYGPTADESL